MGNVLVVIEQRENVIQTVSLELLGKATEIAKIMIQKFLHYF